MKLRRTLLVFGMWVIAAACGGESDTTDAGSDAAQDSTTADVADVTANDVQSSDVVEDAIVDAGPLCDPQKPFGTPVILNTLNLHFDAGAVAGNTRLARLSTDLKTAYFNDGAFIYEATRPTNSGDAFGAATPLATISADAGIDTAPTLSPDGLTLYFTSTRAGAAALYVATRANASTPFSTATAVTGISATPVLVPILQANGQTLFFADGTNVYTATMSGAVATNVAPLSELAFTQSISGGLAITGDGLTLFYSRSAGTDGGAVAHYKIWSATRTTTSTPFANFTYMDALNTPEPGQANDDITFVSADTCVLLLTSFRDGNSNVYESRKPL